MLPHWKAPTVIACSLATACLLAVGHHLYYHSLEGHPVTNDHLLAIHGWSGVSSQRFHTAVGTTFASLVRTFLVIAATVAYTQVLWRTLKSHRSTLSVADAVADALGNPLAFFMWNVWRKHFLLLSLALIAWLVPIASVVTPATLTVVSAPIVKASMLKVPSTNFSGYNFASFPENAEGECLWEYTGPQFAVNQVVGPVVAQGDILPFPAPDSQPNASYTTSFIGPALTCAEVTQPLLGNILSNINNVSGTPGSSVSYGYLAWTPSSSSSMPFVQNTNTTWLLQDGGSAVGAESNWGVMGPQSADQPTPVSTLFIATLPNMTDVYLSQGFRSNATATNSAIIQCQLVNTTYHASFNWTNGLRSVDLVVDKPTGTVVPQSVVYCDQMYNLPPANVSNLVQTLAYQSVMDAFSSILLGAIGNVEGTIGGLVIQGTNVMNTVLGTVPELSFLTKYAAANSVAQAVNYNDAVNSTAGPSPVPTTARTNELDLRTSLEQLFHNATVSLMTSQLLQANMSNIDYPSTANVTFTTYSNFYAYSPLTLWLAYGIAIFLTGIPVIVSYVALFESGLSYSASLSTTVRLASHAHISVPISSQDAIGHDPLPDHLAKATIAFEDRWRNEGKQLSDTGSLSEGIAEGPHATVPTADSQLLSEHE